MTRRVVLTLAYLGGVLFLLAGLWTLFCLEFVCLGGCVPVEVPNRVIQLLPSCLPFLAPGIVMMLIAWIVCLVLLRRAQWLGWHRTVFAAPLLIVPESLVAIIITWDLFAQTSALYRTVAEGSYPVFLVTVMASILLTLVANLIVIVAGHRLRCAGRQVLIQG